MLNFKPNPNLLPQLSEEDSSEESSDELELPADVFKQGSTVVIRVPVVGAKEEDVSVTIRGSEVIIYKAATPHFTLPTEDYFGQECFWGPLSRKITLDLPINPERASAKLERGVLSVYLPLLRERTKIVKIDEKGEGQ